MSLPYSSSSPADSDEKGKECEEEAGAAMKRLLELDLKPRDIMTKAAFEVRIGNLHKYHLDTPLTVARFARPECHPDGHDDWRLHQRCSAHHCDCPPQNVTIVGA